MQWNPHTIHEAIARLCDQRQKVNHKDSGSRCKKRSHVRVGDLKKKRMLASWLPVKQLNNDQIFGASKLLSQFRVDYDFSNNTYFFDRLQNTN